MKKRNPIAVALLPLVTFGIYAIYWEVKTKGEMNALGTDIPTAWLIIVPFVNIWWLWKYCEGVEKVTGGKLNGVLSFVLIFLVGSIGQAIVQDSFNNNVASTAPATAAGSSPLSESPAPTTPAETQEVAATPAPTESQPVSDATSPTDQPPTNNA